MKFAQFLKYLIEFKKYRLRDLAEKSGVHDSDLSKIINGRRPCGSKLVGPILSSLEAEHQAAALVNWLLDQIPVQYLGLVHIVRAEGQSVKEEAPDLGTLEGSMAVLLKQSEVNDSLRVVLMNMARAFVSG